MKYGSYIASGFKYGLISTPGNLPHSIRSPLYEAMRQDNNLNAVARKDLELDAPIYPEMLVPFESVDGLSLEDLSHYNNLLLNNRYLVFTMYDSIASFEDEGIYNIKFGSPKERAFIHYLYVIDTEQEKERSIDEMVEYQLISSIGHMKNQNKRRALGFLEKYICFKKSDVHSDVQKYLDKNNPREHYISYTQTNRRLIEED